MANRIFYITQGSLTIWRRNGQTLDETRTFADSDAGLKDFDAHVSQHADETSLVLIDVIEEEFAVDTIPKLGFRDRSALLERRAQRKFPRSLYRLSVYQGPSSSGSIECTVVHSAVSNHELLDAWLAILLQHQVPLTGVYSVPVMGGELVKRLHSPEDSQLFLTQHQGEKLRQVFLKNGRVQSARLSQTPSIDDPGYATIVVNEIQRSRRYLERTRLLGNTDTINVFVVASADIAAQITRRTESHAPTRFHFIEPAAAAKKVGLADTPAPDRLEALYIAQAMRHRPKHGYRINGEKRYFHMRRARHTLIGMALAASVVCSVMAGLFLSDALYLKNRTAQVEEQVARLSETYRRENERFDPIRADSHEMKLAVDTGDYILANRLPVPWVMRELGRVLGDYPDVQVKNLNWRVDVVVSGASPRRDRSMPVAVPATSAVSAEVTAELTPFDGDMRAAFARIDALAADLQARTAFSSVAAVEYPLDASPNASISGEIGTNTDNGIASFRLHLRYSLNAGGDAKEVSDDAA